MKYQKIRIFLFAALIAPISVQADTVSIQCSCKTKHNPSECSIATQEFQIIEWNEDAHTNPSINWDEEMLSKYCQRHKHDACMCEGEGIYSGKT